MIDFRNAGRTITTQRYECGRYTFRSVLPVVGSTGDKPQWIASIDGAEMLERFPTLEAAMQTAAARQEQQS